MQIEKAYTGGFDLYRIPGLVVTGAGTLLGYYECRRSVSDWADIDLRVIRSTDEGEHWETVLQLPSGGNTLNNPMMIVDGETIHFLYQCNYKQLFCCQSKDDGKTFSQPQEITQVFDNCGFFYNAVAIGPGHGIVHKGKLLLPVWYAYNQEDALAHWPSRILTIYSEDGIRWSLGEQIGDDRLVDASECALAVTAEDRVLISIRNANDQRQRAFAVSDSGWGNWQDLHFKENMPDPICMGSMCQENGTIFHVNCADAKAREHLTVKASRDNFQTWESICLSERAGYADIAIKDGTLYVLYEGYCTDGLFFKKLRYSEETGFTA